MTVGNDLVANLRATSVGPSLLHRLQFEEGWKHGNLVADGWAGAVMQKSLEIQKHDEWTNGTTYQPTDRHGKV